MDLSIVVPLFNEDESLKELFEWIERVVEAEHYEWEVIFIDDGSNDKSWEIIEELAHSSKNVKGIKFQRNYGKSAALHSAFQISKGEVVITMDADMQDSPDEIPGLYKMVKEENWDIVSGWKKKRYDPISKTVPSKFFNWTARKVTRIKLHDFNCGLKAYKGAVVKSIEVYGEMHRYIPVLAKQAGFSRITEKIVQHRKRKYGITKFGLERFINGFLDLLSITFITKFGKRPMHLFGTLGTLMFIVGFVASIWLGTQKLINLFNHIPSKLVTDSPYFYIALTCMIIGTQLFLTGFIGELMSRSSSDRNNYLIESELNIK
ncbi:MAG: glycosyltransferase [Chlorobi bacterium]|nr:glycosyltransferase [Chlorobiota bacterium]